MVPRRLKVCDAFGIPVYLDVSFVILLAMFVTGLESFTLGLGCAVALALSVTLHELGHALSARAFGYSTRDITISLIGGCASLISLPRKPWQEAVTAVAGPAVSFALSGLAWCALAFLPVSNGWTVALLWYAMSMNAMLGAFNLLPGFPMDGGRVFRSAASLFTTRARATYWAMIVGRVFAVYLALRGLHMMFAGGSWGFVSLLIAWMIWREGGREYEVARLEEEYGGGGSRGWFARVSPPPYGGREDEVDVT